MNFIDRDLPSNRMLQAVDWRSLAVCECTRAYYVGMHRVGIRPMERHRWHYTYWQDTRDRPQVWVAGVTPLLSSSLARLIPTANPSVADDISAVLHRARAQRDRENDKELSVSLSAYNRSEFTRETRSSRLGQVVLHEKTRVCDIHLDYRQTWLSRSSITGFWTLQNGKYTAEGTETKF